MTQEELLKTIRAEIERLNNLNKQIAKEQGATDFIQGITAGYAEVLSFLDTMQEQERPEPYNPTYDEAYLNEKIKKATESWKGVDVNKMLAECRGYDEPEMDLEEAAKTFATDTLPLGEGTYVDGGEYRGFKAGAQWQKEQIMKEAIEGEISLINVGDDSYVKTLRMSELRKAIQNRNLCCGKVKVIIIKDDGRED